MDLYPAWTRTTESPDGAFALKEWGEVSRSCAHDAVFVPRRPGPTQPASSWPFLEKQTENLKKYHPKAQMWVRRRASTGDWMDEFLAILKTERRGCRNRARPQIR